MPDPSRCYVFTNYALDDWQPVLRVGIRYLAGQYEICPTTDRLHFQGYVVFERAQRIPGAKRLLAAPTAHLEVRAGTHEQALEYVRKEDTRQPGTAPIELGRPPLGQGFRSDVLAVKQLLDNGGTLLDAAEANFGLFLRSHRALREYVHLSAPLRDSPPEVYYYWGPAGSGKTRAAWDSCPDPSRVYAAPIPASTGTAWFDGYVSSYHEVILLDDYYHNFRLTFFLQLLDRYPLLLPVKGGFSPIGNSKIIITSNIPLEEQYPNAPDQNAVRRRFTQVKHFNLPLT